MKILVAGDGRSEIHERAIAASFRELGHDVHEFHWRSFFEGKGVKKFINRVQERLVMGPSLHNLNAAFMKLALEIRPDAIFVYRGVVIFPQAIANLRRLLPGTVVFGYNNDDPFSENQSPFIWRKFIKALPYYDMLYAYRPDNVNDYLKNGAPKSDLLKPWYSRDLHYPVTLSEADKAKYESDVTFIGHFEDDCRAGLISLLLENGIKVKLFGPMEAKHSGWTLALKANPKLQSLLPTRMLWGEDYNKAIVGAKITLCFLSKLNRDKYTRRCFEIPAVGGLLFSEYTDELAAMFREGEEADYFRGSEDFLRKIQWYLNNDDVRRRVAKAGHVRVLSEGNDGVARARKIVEDFQDLVRIKDRSISTGQPTEMGRAQ